MEFRVEGGTEASLTSDVFVACLFQHSWRKFASLQSRRTGLKQQGCVAGSEAVSPQAVHKQTCHVAAAKDGGEGGAENSCCESFEILAAGIARKMVRLD